MKNRNKIWVALTLPILLLGVSNTSSAADDPSIKGNLRSAIQMAMTRYITNQSIEGQVYLYDAVAGRLLKMTLLELQEGIMQKNGFYVSCADFSDQDGRLIDIDFLVRASKDQLVTTQAIVPSIDGKKRKYHLEKS